MALQSACDTLGKALKPPRHTGLSEIQLIVLLLFSPSKFLCACVFFARPHCVMFSWEMCFINDSPRLYCVIWDTLTKLLVLSKRRKKFYLQTANSFPEGLADFISGASLLNFHFLGFEDTIKAYVWYCVMWFCPRAKQSLIFKENPIFPNELIITNSIVEICGLF